MMKTERISGQTRKKRRDSTKFNQNGFEMKSKVLQAEKSIRETESSRNIKKNIHLNRLCSGFNDDSLYSIARTNKMKKYDSNEKKKKKRIDSASLQ